MATYQGSIHGSGNKQGRAEMSFTTSETATTLTATATFYIRSRYQCSDSSNTNKWDWDGTPSTSLGSKSVKHTSSSSWSSSNKTKVASKSKTFTKGTSASSKTVSYQFSGIEYAGGGATCKVSHTFTVPALAHYTVSFNANGGSNAPSAQTKYYGSALTLSSTKPTRTGYTFMGWGTSASATTVSYASGGSYTANSGTTLYAIWKKDITVSFNGNGGSDANPITKSVYNATTSTSFEYPTPARVGWEFLGWNIDKNALTGEMSGIHFGDITLYAIWRKPLFVHYHRNGGDGVDSSEHKYIYNAETQATFTITSQTYSKENHQFDGWSLTPDGNIRYVSGNEVNIKEDLDLYASYSQIATWSTDTNRVWLKIRDEWVLIDKVYAKDTDWHEAELKVKYNPESLGGE